MTRFLPGYWLAIVSGLLLIQPASAQPPAFKPPPYKPTLPLRDESPADRPLPTEAEVKAQNERLYKEYIAAPLQKYCFGCHGDKKATAGLNLQRLKPDFVTSASAEQWRRVLERMRFHEMPPRTAKMTPGAELELDRVSGNLVDYLEMFVAGARDSQPQFLQKLAPVLVKLEDSRSTSLQKQLRNSAAARIPVTFDGYELGRISLRELMTSVEEFADTDYVLAKTREERIASLQQSVKIAREIEDYIYWHRGPFRAGTEDQVKLYTIKVKRLELQIRLQAEIDGK